jgi:hypothetical protein
MQKVNGLLLPKTGQVTSYATGDDGEALTGNKLSPRVIVNGNLVYDLVTLLCWVREVPKIIPNGNGIDIPTAKGVWNSLTSYVINDLVVGDGSPDAKYYICTADHINHEPPNSSYWIETIWTASAVNLTTNVTLNWATCIANCLMTYAGHSPWSVTNPYGWRLPNINELLSIIDWSTNTPPVNSTIFPNVSGSYWCSTTVPISPYTSAIRVAMTTTVAFGSIAKTSSYNLRPVRSFTI